MRKKKKVFNISENTKTGFTLGTGYTLGSHCSIHLLGVDENVRISENEGGDKKKQPRLPIGR